MVLLESSVQMNGTMDSARPAQSDALAALSAYMPQDRRRAHATGMVSPPQESWGAVLFADLTGFTPMTERLVATLGRRQGVDALLRLLNRVYPPLIEAVDAWAGTVIGFSGDAITCWFGAENVSPARAGCGEAVACAVHAAAAMQRAMYALAPLLLVGAEGDAPALRVTITCGKVVRTKVGDPAHYLLDALAGATVDRIAVGDALARRGEIVIDAAGWEYLQQDGYLLRTHAEWRTDGVVRFAPIDETDLARRGAPPSEWLTLPVVPEESAQPWVLPALRGAISGGQEEFSAELRPAAALFVRFAGIDFTQGAAAAAQMDGYVRWVQSIVARYDGALIQVTTGDKGAYLYAVFGAPIAHDDDVQRALLAALEIVAPPQELNYISGTQIGVSHGLMRVGAYGGPTRRTYGVQGDAVNTAARLMSAAAPGEILATAAVAEIVAESQRGRAASAAFPVAIVQHGKLTLKGKGEATYFRVLRRATGEPMGGTRFDAPLVGREEELARIAATLAQVGGNGEASGRLIVLEGPAGIGKSHLLSEAVAQAIQAQWIPLAAASHSTTQQTPFSAARQFVTVLLGIDPGESRGERVIDALNGWVVDAALRAPLLNDLLGVSLAESEFTRGLEARTRQEALIALLIELIQRRSATSKLLFVLEDSHWLDESSSRILGALLAMLEYAPVAAITTVRPRALPESIQAQERLTLHIDVGDLASTAIDALVARRLGAPLSALASALVLAQSQGNPFFAEEFADALVEAGSLVRAEEGSATRWDLAPGALAALRSANCLEGDGDETHLREHAPILDANLGVPGSIHGIILARLDRLPDIARLTLKVASVVGRTFSKALLERVQLLVQHRPELNACMDVALARDFVRMADVQDEEAGEGQASTLRRRLDRYYFKHNLIRDVAYSTLLDAQQKELHTQVAAALEGVQPEATEELANHYARGDTSNPQVRTRALDYLGAAARKAQAEYANETALAFYNRALGLNDDPALMGGCAEVLHVLGRREEQATMLSRLATAATASAWEVARLRVDYHEALGDYDEAQRWLERALTVSRNERNVANEARVKVKQGMISWRQGEFEAARATLDAALSIAESVAEGAEIIGAQADALYGLGLVNRQQGRLDEAQRCFAEDLALRERAPNPEREARALNAIGNIRAMLRDPDDALDYYQRALAIRRRIGDRAGVGSSLLAIAQCYSTLARIAEAEPMLREALRIQRAVRNRFQECLVGNELGILQWLIGDYSAAEATLRDSLSIARALESDMLEAYVLCNLGQVQRDGALAQAAAQGGLAHAPSDKRAEAIATLERGLAMALEQEDTQLAAIYQGDLALALHLAGENARALAMISEAELSYRAIEQERDLSTVLPTRARILLAMGQDAEARAAARAAIAILDAAPTEPHEFAHRDYYHAGSVLANLGERDEAEQAFAAARAHLLARADRISSPVFRQTFLENVAHNREILALTR